MASMKKEADAGQVSEMMASFVMTMSSCAHSLPATQVYGYDTMIVKIPGKSPSKSLGIFVWFSTFSHLSCLLEQARLHQVWEIRDGLGLQGRIGRLPMQIILSGMPRLPVGHHV